MKRISTTIAFVLMLAAGLAGGIALTWAVLDRWLAPGMTRHGRWVAWMKAGAPDADPYSLASMARRGEIPMTPSEGLAFFASRDDGGSELDAACHYEIAGAFPPARAWTLTIYTPDGRVRRGPSGRSGFTSAEALSDGSRVAIQLSAAPQPGNWIPLAAGGRMVAALRLYDTPLSAETAAPGAGRLPSIRRVTCP
ncbi:MAG: DUF1214 domain-containing protein [Methylocystis sp.]|nr:DUF1214 domain-containing protein [Methylocystis sp.]MCA3582980.1 DUF1214 domain-containing protein [Methylocystis sp.]MCA3587303.1 DUF1214 domain-containing protein [Methylocystis sp.]MCA3590385.1 DUF1214 domain-containing protein [Methylocystis sp.]